MVERLNPKYRKMSGEVLQVASEELQTHLDALRAERRRRELLECIVQCHDAVTDLSKFLSHLRPERLGIFGGSPDYIRQAAALLHRAQCELEAPES